jgi:hypothetical protein
MRLQRREMIYARSALAHGAGTLSAGVTVTLLHPGAGTLQKAHFPVEITDGTLPRANILQLNSIRGSGYTAVTPTCLSLR